jgi:hypothetical protein
MKPSSRSLRSGPSWTGLSGRWPDTPLAPERTVALVALCASLQPGTTSLPLAHPQPLLAVGGVGRAEVRIKRVGRASGHGETQRRRTRHDMAEAEARAGPAPETAPEERARVPLHPNRPAPWRGRACPMGGDPGGLQWGRGRSGERMRSAGHSHGDESALGPVGRSRMEHLPPLAETTPARLRNARDQRGLVHGCPTRADLASAGLPRAVVRVRVAGKMMFMPCSG